MGNGDTAYRDWPWQIPENGRTASRIFRAGAPFLYRESA